MPTTYPIHPVADCWPMLGDMDLAAMAADIKANGLLHPIELLGNQIIDGRNRLRACELAGVTPRYQEIQTADPVSYAKSANDHRRHLDQEQRKAIAARLANLKHGTNRFETQIHSEDIDRTNVPSINKMSIAEAAKLMNVNPKSVQRAKAEMRDNPAAHEAALHGDKEALKAARAAHKARTPDQQARIDALKVELSGKLDNLGRLKAESKALADANRQADLLDPYWRAEKQGNTIHSDLIDIIQRIEIYRHSKFPVMIHQKHIGRIRDALNTLAAFIEEQEHAQLQRNSTTIHCESHPTKH